MSEVTIEELAGRLDDVLVLDVRTPQEYDGTGGQPCDPRQGHIPGGLTANREFAECVVGYENGISEEIKTMLFDPQTAGGLLISVAAEGSDELVRALRTARVPARQRG